jgi:hypothetical protein
VTETPSLTELLGVVLDREPMSATEREELGRAVSKGYAYPFDAYRLGMEEAVRAIHTHLTAGEQRG